MYRIVLLLVFLVPYDLICMNEVLAQKQSKPQLVNLREAGKAYVIEEELEILEDKSAQLTFSEVLKLDSLFKPSRQQPNFGPSASAVWCKIRIMNHTKEEWYLEVGTPFLQEVSLYQELSGNMYRHVQLSSDWDFNQRPIKTNLFVIPLKASTELEQTYYLRFRSNFILNFPLRVATLPQVYEENFNTHITFGLYFGLLLALILYNLFVWITIRDRTYLYYVVFLFANGMYVLYTSGYGLAYFYPHQPWLNQPNYYAATAQIFGILLTHSFLLVRQYIPRLRWLSWIILLLAACTIGLTISGRPLPGFEISVLNVILIAPYVYIMGISVYRKGFKPALFYIIAFTMVNTGVLIYCLQNLLIIPFNSFTGNAFMIGSALEAVVLSFALAHKLHTFKKQKEHAQARALEQSTAFSRQLIQTQERERKRIAAELHDSIGQSLGLIKNRLLLLQQTKQVILPTRMDELTELVGQTLQEVRSISHALRPPQLDLLGLSKAIGNLVEETASASEIQFYEDIDNVNGMFSKEAEMNLYRIIQECLSNMIRHSDATEGKVLLVKKEKHLILVIEDNGKGMLSAASDKGQAGSGLPGIRERLHFLGGILKIKNAVPQGALLHIIIPIQQ